MTAQPMPLARAEVEDALRNACDWLVDVAQVKTRELTVEVNSMKHPYADWRGAIRGEYSAAKREWSFFCPIWHTGQAVKALMMASRVLKDSRYVDAARLGGMFITDKQVWDSASCDHGLILAYEDFPQWVTTSAVLECMDGMLMLAEAERSENLAERLVEAVRFLIDKLYVEGQGLFRDVYDPQRHEPVTPDPYRTKQGAGGRPLLDDAICLKLYHRTNDKRFLDVHVQVSERLVRDQRPPGNWVDYGPCSPQEMRFHPRHTYWWGRPLLDTFRQTGRREFLETAVASGEFTLRALRSDGGYFRSVYLESDGYLNTDSFGHATSGAACGAIFFLDLYEQTAQTRWLAAAQRALAFCVRMQMRQPQDPNLRGVIVEKVVPPDGTDRSPYHVRDLGTIFFIQAAVRYLQMPAYGSSA